MQKVIWALACVTAVTGCGGPVGIPPPAGRDISVAETPAANPLVKPTLDQLKGLIPPTLAKDELTEIMAEPEEPEEPAPLPEGEQDEATGSLGVDETGLNIGPSRAGVGGRGGRGGGIGPGAGAFGAGVARSRPAIGPGRQVSPGDRHRVGPGDRSRVGPGDRHRVGPRDRHRTYRDRWFPRHGAYYRHRIWWGNTWLRPLNWGTYVLYPVVYAGTPWYVRYCVDPSGGYAPCGVLSLAEVGIGGPGGPVGPVGPVGAYGSYGSYGPTEFGGTYGAYGAYGGYGGFGSYGGSGYGAPIGPGIF